MLLASGPRSTGVCWLRRSAVLFCFWHWMALFAWSSTCIEAFQALQANPYASAEHQWELYRLEQARLVHLEPEKKISEFRSEVGFSVVERDRDGNALKARIRVLVDNPHVQLSVISELNGWGTALKESDYLKRAGDGPYYEAVIDVRHAMEYRFVLNGRQVLDPGAEGFTTAEFHERKAVKTGQANLNSIYWDFDRPGGYRMQTSSVDLRGKPLIIAETEPWQLAKNWEFQGKRGPRIKAETYRFVAESGIVEQIRSMGYNAIELMPLAPHVEYSTSAREGDGWWILYQAFGSFGPSTNYGTPEEFAMMVDAFNKAGIAVILDIVPGHFPYRGNQGIRSLAEIGIHHFIRGDGRHLFGGEVPTEYGTYRYDYSNPYVRRFLIDGALTMMKRYGLSGFRLDNPDGIRSYSPGGGETFMRELVVEVRKYRPEAVLIAEQFCSAQNTTMALNKSGLGFGFRTHYDWFHQVVRNNTLVFDEQIDMSSVQRNIRGIWPNTSQIYFVTNHDLAGNDPEGGATGDYFASLLRGGDWKYVEGKTKAWGALSMLSGSAYYDMPQFRFLQEGDLNSNPEVEWSLLNNENHRGVNQFFSHLSWTIRDNIAFAFVSSHPEIENHIDHQAKVISLMRMNFANGKRYYAVINLSSRPLDNYVFGIHQPGNYKVLVDSDRLEYRGTGTLSSRLPSGGLSHSALGAFGKPYSLTIPHLAPFGVLLLEAK